MSAYPRLLGRHSEQSRLGRCPALYMLFAIECRMECPRSRAPCASERPRRCGSGPVADQASDARQHDTLLSLDGQSSPTADGTHVPFQPTGLPDGLSIDADLRAWCHLRASLTAAGRFLGRGECRRMAQQTVSTEFAWTVNEPGTTRYVLLEARSNLNGNPWSSAAEVEPA